MSQHQTKARRYPRFEVHDVEGVVLYNLQAEVINMSIAGMAVETTRPLDVGRTYAFSIRRGAAGGEVRMPGVVVWCMLHRTRRISETEIAPVYQAGVHFADVLSDNASALLHLIEESVTLDVNRRIFGRFKPNGGATVTIASEIDFEVQKISLSGMLIETSMRAEQEDYLPMEINLPQRRIAFRGRVAYLKALIVPENSPPRYNIGIEFHDLNAQDRGLLEQFIADMVEKLSDLLPGEPHP
jgi:hypothetical protein